MKAILVVLVLVLAAGCTTMRNLSGVGGESKPITLTGDVPVRGTRVWVHKVITCKVETGPWEQIVIWSRATGDDESVWVFRTHNGHFGEFADRVDCEGIYIVGEGMEGCKIDFYPTE